MELAKLGFCIVASVSLANAGALAQVQVLPAPAKPTRPAPPTTKPAPVKPTPLPQPVRPTPPITKPAPVKPTPLPQPVPSRPVPQPQPIRPNPVKPVRPTPLPQPVRPPNYDYRHHWDHGYRPPLVIGWNHAVLFSGHFGSGYYLPVRYNIPDLRAYGFDDRTQSLYARGRWMVCTKTRYRGTCRTYRGPQGLLPFMGGRISSIRYVGR